jgi:hypothetical protein
VRGKPCRFVCLSCNCDSHYYPGLSLLVTRGLVQLWPCLVFGKCLFFFLVALGLKWSDTLAVDSLQIYLRRTKKCHY